MLYPLIGFYELLNADTLKADREVLIRLWRRIAPKQFIGLITAVPRTRESDRTDSERPRIPQYQYSLNTNRFRDKYTGKYVSRVKVMQVMIEANANLQDYYRNLIEGYLDENISLEELQLRSYELVRTSNTMFYAVNRGGLDQMAANDYLAVARATKEQYKSLGKFFEDLNRGYSINKNGKHIEMSPPMVTYKFGQFAKAAGQRANDAAKTMATNADKSYGFRILASATEHCPDCPKIAGLGVQKISDLILPGNSCVCRSECKCRIEYFSTREEAKKAWGGRTRAMLPGTKSDGEELSLKADVAQGELTQGYTKRSLERLRLKKELYSLAPS